MLPANGLGGAYHLDRIDLFNLLCVPGETDADTVSSLQEFCRDSRALLIVDCPQGASFNLFQSGDPLQD